MNEHRSGMMDIDYLIVGGGIQGLTLLDQLVAAGAGRVLLVTRDLLGAGESLHSHGYMHLGYTLPTANAALAGDLANCAAHWWRRMERLGSSYLSQPPTYFGVSEREVAERVGIWDQLGLPYEALDAPPEPLRGGGASGEQVCHFRIHDRTVSMRELIEDLAAPHQERIVRAELARIDLDASGRQVARCHLLVGPPGSKTLVLRPRFLLMATGRFSQPLLRNATAPDGSQPLAAAHREFHRVRLVPMLLVRGRNLPPLTTILQSHSVSIAAHPVTREESMWIVTYQRDQVSDRGDFDEARESARGSTLSVSLDLLAELVPALRERRTELRYSFYFGGKIDHPDGGNARYVGDRGVANLRVLWPGLWSLALANAQVIRDELQTEASGPLAVSPSMPPGGEFLDPPLRRGVPVGEERRLMGAQPWWSYAEVAARSKGDRR